MKKKTVRIIAVSVLIVLLASLMSACTLFRGQSAYDIAVDNGFVGTESEWLESLKGANGSNGLSGSDGQDIDIEKVYDSAVRNGFEGTYLEFLQEYLTLAPSDALSKETIADNLASTVSILCAFDVTTMSGFPTISGVTSTSITGGSGVIYSLDKESGNAYILTNYHICYYAGADNQNMPKSITLYLYGGLVDYDQKTGTDVGGSGITAEYVGGSLNYDIAVLKVENSDVLKASQAQAVTLGDSDALTVGENVVVVGNPEAFGMSATSGIISVTSEYLTMKAADNYTTVTYRVIRTDASINSGNSGGGLYDALGRLIGIVNAKYDDGQTDNMGFALPIGHVTGIAENILANYGKVMRVTIGISTSAIDSTAIYNPIRKTLDIVETIAIDSVGSNAIANGKLEVGDILKAVTVDDVRYELTRNYQLQDLMLRVQLGDTIVLEIERSGAPISVSLTFDALKHFTEVK